eukprot:m.65075 g.65075  ORF g.65075 m.65075 type:complete len:272 (+) comp11704_c0_seq1:173-988(+)
MNRNNAINLSASFASGTTSAVAFNWFDKAQYSSIKYNREFFDVKNFKEPFHGVLNSVVTKFVSNGLYFYWIDNFRAKTSSQFQNLSAAQVEFIAGNASGAACAIISNPLSAVKYRNWDKHTSTFKVAQSMWKDGGLRPFLKGVESRILRDAVFSSIFVMSHYTGRTWFGETNPMLLFCTDNIAVVLATTLSSPFNFIMNRQYAAKPYNPYPKATAVLQDIKQDIIKHRSLAIRMWDMFHVGPGNFRIALGMTISHRIYQWTQHSLDQTLPY